MISFLQLLFLLVSSNGGDALQMPNGFFRFSLNLIFKQLVGTFLDLWHCYTVVTSGSKGPLNSVELINILGLSKFIGIIFKFIVYFRPFKFDLFGNLFYSLMGGWTWMTFDWIIAAFYVVVGLESFSLSILLIESLKFFKSYFVGHFISLLFYFFESFFYFVHALFLYFIATG